MHLSEMSVEIGPGQVAVMGKILEGVIVCVIYIFFENIIIKIRGYDLLLMLESRLKNL